MADLKISEMVGATEVANADVVPVVQGGANAKATRALLLTAAPGEAISLAGNGGGSFEIDPSGNVTGTASGGYPLTLSANGATIRIDGAGIVTLSGPSGNQVVLDSAGNLSLGVFGGLSVSIFSAAGATIAIGTAGEIRVNPAGGQSLTIAGSAWPDNAAGFLANDGSGVLTWAGGAGPAGSTAMTIAGGSGGPVFSDSAFNGGIGASAYSIDDIVQALKVLGLLAE